MLGKRTIYIDTNKKLGTKALGGTVPDGFFIDQTDADNPAFYLVEVELASHDFFGHIFPQITKFFAFYENQTSLKSLVETLHELIEKDRALKRKLKRLIGKQEPFKYLNDLLHDSQNILLIINDDKREIVEVMDTYTEWRRHVKHLTVRKFISRGETAFVVNPSFGDIEFVPPVGTEKVEDVLEPPTEADHLKQSSKTVGAIYGSLKKLVHKRFPDLTFNPRRYYISIRAKKNIAYVTLQKSKLRIVIMSKEAVIRSHVQNYKIKSLSASVQNYYGAPCGDVPPNVEKCEIGIV